MNFKNSLESKVQSKEHQVTMIEKEVESLRSKNQVCDYLFQEQEEKHKLEIDLLTSKHQKESSRLSLEISELNALVANLKLELQGSQAECAQYKVMEI
jgi:outer membrane murein-binding lipoprotein Lpp